MFLKVLNYSTRGIIVLLGLVFLLDFGLLPSNTDASLIKMMGAIMILFGVYRIILYYFALKKEERDETIE